MKSYKLIILLLPVFFSSCMKDVSGVVDITVDDLKTIIREEKKVQILDVRLESEAEEGMILNAININLISNDFETKAINELDINEPVYVYCRSGARSKIASKLLIDKGYEVFNIEGGYKDWLKED